MGKKKSVPELRSSFDEANSRNFQNAVSRRFEAEGEKDVVLGGISCGGGIPGVVFFRSVSIEYL